jgi:hypothetical protein
MGTRWAMPKNPETGHIVYSPAGEPPLPAAVVYRDHRNLWTVYDRNLPSAPAF